MIRTLSLIESAAIPLLHSAATPYLSIEWNDVSITLIYWNPQSFTLQTLNPSDYWMENRGSSGISRTDLKS